MLETLQFVHEDAAQIISEMKTDMEAALNIQIAPADVEMLLINAYAYRELILRAGINETGRQNLVHFARGAALDYLAELFNLYRMPAATAKCTIMLTFVEAHPTLTIPAGIRIATTDSKVIFSTLDSIVVHENINSVTAEAYATNSGVYANDYVPNTINIILDPQAYLSAAKNTETSRGGSDNESDSELRERIKLAPAAFSVAGPAQAYRFHAMSATPAIIDVSVTSLSPGDVNIYILLENGVPPNNAIINAVHAICNSEKIRPLCDTVIVSAASIIDYEIEVEVTLLQNTIASSAEATILEKLNEWVTSRKNKLGLDVVRNKISAISMLDGIVYNVNVISPSLDIVADSSMYTNCTQVKVKILGYHEQ